MKRFEQLTKEEQDAAVLHCTASLLEAIMEGMGFNDELNHDDLQKRIDAAIAKAEKMQTPWFAHEYIMDTCKEEIEGMARSDAEDGLYSEPGEQVIAHVCKPVTVAA